MATGDGAKAGASEQAGRHEGGQQQPEAPSVGTAAVTPAVAPSVSGEPESDAPEVLSPRGGVIVRLDSPLVTSFELTVGTGEDAEPITLTSVGVRVNKAQAQQILETAVAHGVTVRLDPANEESE